MKVGVYVAHEDDAILGVGGIIIQHLEKGDDVYIVVCTDGRNSHKAVLGIKNNPTPLEVAKTRKEEFFDAIDVLGCKRKNIFYLDTEDGTVRNNIKTVSKQIASISKEKTPDIIYFHHPDAHRDHQAASEAVKTAFNDLKYFPQAYQFFIWTREVYKGKPKFLIYISHQTQKNAKRVNIKNELKIKREALYKMKSQILLHPYRSWQTQRKPILDKDFLDFFLRGEETILKLDW